MSPCRVPLQGRVAWLDALERSSVQSCWDVKVEDYMASCDPRPRLRVVVVVAESPSLRCRCECVVVVMIYLQRAT